MARVDDNAIDPVAATVALYAQMIDLPMFGLGSHTPRLFLAKQITAALEVMTIAEQERYYTTIHQVRVARETALMSVAPASKEEVIEWG